MELRSVRSRSGLSQQKNVIAMDHDLPRFEELNDLSADEIDHLTEEEYEQITMEYYQRQGGHSYQMDFLRVYGPGK